MHAEILVRSQAGNSLDNPLGQGRDCGSRVGAYRSRQHVPAETTSRCVSTLAGAPLPTSCTYCGECDVGCNTHSKNSVDLNYLYVAEHVHRATVQKEDESTH